MSGRDEQPRRRVFQTSPHKERVDKAAYMIRVGMTDNEIIDFFSQFENYSEENTRRQLDRIRPLIENNQ